MTLIKKSPFWMGVVYFLILLSIAFWVRDIPHQLDAFTMTPQQLSKTSQMGDPASFVTAAIEIAENGWISDVNDWVFNAWPPGFILLEAMIIKIMGPDVPLILVLQILAAVLFSILLTLLFYLFRAKVDSRLAFALPLLIFAFPVSRVFLLQPIGISLGESFSIGFFLICVLLAIRSVDKNSLYVAVCSGLCLALSAYFRPQFEIILLALSCWWVLIIIAIKWMPIQKVVELKNIKSVVQIGTIILLVAHAATFPWRGYHWVNEGSPLWVYSAGGTVANSVKTTEELKKLHGGFVAAGGGNLVCRIDPVTCGDADNAKQMFVKIFVSHIDEWYSLKSDVIGQYWFSSIKNWVSISAESTLMDTLVNGILLITLMAIIVLLLMAKARSHKMWIILLWFNVSLFSTYFLIFTFVHFEVRYFYFPKIAGLVMLLIVASLYIRPKKKKDLDNKHLKSLSH